MSRDQRTPKDSLDTTENFSPKRMTMLIEMKLVSSSCVAVSHLGSGSPDFPDHHEADDAGKTRGVLQLPAQVEDAESLVSMTTEDEGVRCRVISG